MTLLGREVAEVEALVTDRYLDSLLAAGELVATGSGTGGRRSARDGATGRAGAGGTARLDEAVRLASRRLTRDLPRFHPSFRFEERLAIRLAQAAAQMRLPAAAGAEGSVTVLPVRGGTPDDAFDPLADPDPEGDETAGRRPLLVNGALAASALSLAGAAFVAWRRARGGSAMARAARAAHALRERPI